MPLEECEGEDSDTEGIYQAEDTRIEAPKWDTDGLKFFKDIRQRSTRLSSRGSARLYNSMATIKIASAANPCFNWPAIAF